MLTAIIGSVTAILGAIIGAVVATRNERRRELTAIRLAANEAAERREAELKTLALAMAKTELARNPESDHSLAAHFLVIKTLLAKHDVEVTGSDEAELTEAHQAMSYAYKIQCQVPLGDDFDGNTEEAQLAGAAQALESVAALESVVADVDAAYCAVCGVRLGDSTRHCVLCDGLNAATP